MVWPTHTHAARGVATRTRAEYERERTTRVGISRCGKHIRKSRVCARGGLAHASPTHTSTPSARAMSSSELPRARALSKSPQTVHITLHLHGAPELGLRSARYVTLRCIILHGVTLRGTWSSLRSAAISSSDLSCTRLTLGTKRPRGVSIAIAMLWSAWYVTEVSSAETDALTCGYAASARLVACGVAEAWRRRDGGGERDERAGQRADSSS